MLTMSWRESLLPSGTRSDESHGDPGHYQWLGSGPAESLGHTGALIDPRNPTDAAEALLGLLSHPCDSDALRQRARNFTWDTAVDRTAQLYLSLRKRWGSTSKARMLAARARGVLRAGTALWPEQQGAGLTRRHSTHGLSRRMAPSDHVLRLRADKKDADADQ